MGSGPSIPESAVQLDPEFLKKLLRVIGSNKDLKHYYDAAQLQGNYCIAPTPTSGNCEEISATEIDSNIFVDSVVKLADAIKTTLQTQQERTKDAEGQAEKLVVSTKNLLELVAIIRKHPAITKEVSAQLNVMDTNGKYLAEQVTRCKQQVQEAHSSLQQMQQALHGGLLGGGNNMCVVTKSPRDARGYKDGPCYASKLALPSKTIAQKVWEMQQAIQVHEKIAKNLSAALAALKKSEAAFAHAGLTISSLGITRKKDFSHEEVQQLLSLVKGAGDELIGCKQNVLSLQNSLKATEKITKKTLKAVGPVITSSSASSSSSGSSALTGAATGAPSGSGALSGTSSKASTSAASSTTTSSAPTLGAAATMPKPASPAHSSLFNFFEGGASRSLRSNVPHSDDIYRIAEDISNSLRSPKPERRRSASPSKRARSSSPRRGGRRSTKK